MAQDENRPAVNSREMIRADRLINTPQNNARAAPDARTTSVNIAGYSRILGASARIARYDPATNVAGEIAAGDTIDLKVGEYISIASDELRFDPMVNAQGRQYSTFPAVFITKNADGSINHLRVGHFSEGFAWRKNDAAYEASIYIAAANLDDPDSIAALATPIPVRITGAALLNPPAQIEITQLGFGGEKEIVMHSEARSDPVIVTMRHAIDPNVPTKIDLKVNRPKLTLSANPPGIAGFGVEATEITVNSNGALPSGIVLTLESNAGTLDPKTVTTNDNGIATSKLWSAGIGTATLTILEDRFRVSDVAVEFRKPLVFLIASVLGAALGATFFYFWQRSRSPRNTSLWAWCAAFVFGIGITIAMFAGFDIPQMLDLPQGRAGQVVTFATAFIAAMLTNSIFSVLSGRRGITTTENRDTQ